MASGRQYGNALLGVRRQEAEVQRATLNQLSRNGPRSVRNLLLLYAVDCFVVCRFVLLCDCILSASDTNDSTRHFADDFLHPLLSLHRDRVPNVRISLARTLAKHSTYFGESALHICSHGIDLSLPVFLRVAVFLLDVHLSSFASRVTCSNRTD